MSIINEKKILRHRRNSFCRLLLLITSTLTFDLVTNFPITNDDVAANTEIITSSTTLSTTDSSTIENVTTFKNLNINSTDAIYDYEEIQPSATVTCDAWYEQLCENGIECILKEFMCDGRSDCSDASDEKSDICQNQRVEDYPDSKGRFLPPTLKCPEHWFFCKDASKCIDSSLACNGIDDCKDGSDEGGFCHYLNIERRLSSFGSNSNNETFQEI